jgi:glycosyltransferase involved in cell wall biosynthesis
MSPLTIALVAPSLDTLGGQGVQALALARELRGEGRAVEFIPIDARFPSGLRWLRRYGYLRTLLNQMLYAASLRRLRNVDLVHAFSASYWSFLLAPLPAMVAGRLLGKRVVLHYHSGEAEDHLGRWGLLVHPWLRLADQIVVPSEYLRGVFARHGYRARVIANVVDTSAFRFRVRSRLQPRLVSTRNFEPYYRVANTIQAFALLRRRYPQATLTLAGSGSLEADLRRQAAAAGGGVRFAGRVEPHDIPGVYEEADVFLNSSVVDNQPVSVLEAFAAGTPVVSTSTGDIATLVREGETGVVVPADDPQAMAEAVAGLLEAPARALSIARRAREEAMKHTWPAVRDAWTEVYTQPPGPRSAAPRALRGRLAARSGR